MEEGEGLGTRLVFLTFELSPERLLVAKVNSSVLLSCHCFLLHQVIHTYIRTQVTYIYTIDSLIFSKISKYSTLHYSPSKG